MEIIIPAIAGLISGTIASLIAPWVKWGIEKRKLKREYQIKMINEWKDIILRADFDRRNLLSNPSYGVLSSLLRKEVKEELERPSNHITVMMDSPVSDHDKIMLIQEVGRIEREWDLV